MKSIFQRHKVLWLHISFWCVYISFNLYQFAIFQRRNDRTDWETGLLITLLQLVLTLVIVYLNYFLLLPRFLQRKNLFLYLLELATPFTIVTIVRVYLTRALIEAGSYGRHEHYFYSTIFVVHIVAITLFIVIFIGLLRFAADWFEFEAAKKEVENEKLMAELNFLKAQINPHFLFNTLNNLYYLAYSKSANTTEVIAKLSDVMRYMLYDATHTLVPLSKEIEYMQNYIDLERLRLSDQIPVNVNVEGNVDRVYIAPLILITFLENAFKHGVSTNDPNSWVNITIRVRDKDCIYVVENSKLNKVNGEPHEKSGIGLTNVKRRLELSYPGRYSLEIEDLSDRYSIMLKLQLT